MKLSAPPPPPEPNEPVQPQPGDPSQTDASALPEASTPATPRMLTWPSWFPGADFFLAALAIVLAFMIGSFVAINSDLWLHLAAGKRLLAGEYRPGTDPFSYSASDRPWVNHSLLFDVGSYLLYRADSSGAALVVVKALAVAFAFDC